MQRASKKSWTVSIAKKNKTKKQKQSNGLSPLTNFVKSLILDTSLGSVYTPIKILAKIFSFSK